MRLEKSYAHLDALASDYHDRLIVEFERVEKGAPSFPFSPFLHRLTTNGFGDWMPDAIHPRFPGPLYESANELLRLEKEIRRLCGKLAEPLPVEFLILSEYLEEYLRMEEGLPPWEIGPEKDFHGGHKHLIRKTLDRLRDSKT